MKLALHRLLPLIVLSAAAVQSAGGERAASFVLRSGPALILQRLVRDTDLQVNCVDARAG
jgi:hypothetical protein